MTPAERDVYAKVTRTLAAICLVVSLPLLPLAAAWLPATAVSAFQYYRGLQESGSPSYLAGQRLGLEEAIVSTLLYGAALVVAFLYVTMFREPRPARDAKVWTAGAIVAGCDFFYWTGISAPWLFLAPPATVAVLSMLGASISARAKVSSSMESRVL